MDNLVCVYDGTPATYFCYCNGVYSYLCDIHRSDHATKSQVLHIVFPVKALQYHYGNEGYTERYIMRMNAQTGAIAKMQKNIDKIAICMSEIDAKVIEIVEAVNMQARTALAGLEEAKGRLETEIQQAVWELEEQQYAEKANFSNPLAEKLREYDSKSDSLRLFDYELFPYCEDSTRSFVCYSVHDLPTPTAAPVTQRPVTITPSCIILHATPANPQLSHPLQPPPRSPIAVNSSSVFIGDSELFFCGGRDGKWAVKSAFQWGNTGIEEIDQMTIDRLAHGVFYDSRWPTVFVFGGENTAVGCWAAVKHCEGFSLVTRSWVPLPSMYFPRAAFNPCLHSASRHIYLCGGLGSFSTIEEYNPDINTFKLTPVQLSDHFAKQSGCVAICDSDSILIISAYSFAKWAVSDRTMTETKGKDTNVKWVTAPVVLFGREAYLVCNDTSVKRVNIDTGAIDDVAKTETEAQACMVW